MTAKGQNRHLEGKSVEEIAKEQNKGIMDAFLDLSLDEDLQTCFQAIDRNNDPKTQKHILGSQFTVIGTSDGGGRPHTADRHETSTHLLGHWVRERGAFDLAEGVRRLTSHQAGLYGIPDSASAVSIALPTATPRGASCWPGPPRPSPCAVAGSCPAAACR